MKDSVLRVFRRRPDVAGGAEEPIRAELFSLERLEQHGESLAAAQGLATRSGTDRRLTKRLGDNGRVLLAAYRAIAATIREESAITPAAEWLVDNFHVVEEQIREIRSDLPRGFYRQLPKLAQGPLAGYPRVFGMAWAFVAHTDSRFDAQMLSRFVMAYQRVQPLTIGELWAVAITLRIVLVENLRRAADLIVSSRLARRDADLLADRLLGVGGRKAEAPEALLRGLGQGPLQRAFAVQLVQRLRDQDPAMTPALLWLDQRLAAQGQSADEIVSHEHNRQGAMNVTVRNAITSMRALSAVNWAELFESVSLVDAALRAAGNFAEMDFATRDRYRHAIEELARRSKHTELEVARSAIAAAQRAAGESPHVDEAHARRRQDPGYYLIANGRRALEREIGFSVPLRQWLVRANAATGIVGYLGTIAILVTLISALPLIALARPDIDAGTIVGLALLAFFPALDLSIALANRCATYLFGPKVLPGLELRDGVPSTLRTMIVVPTLLTTPAELEGQIERLEVHHLATPDGDLRFALLSDWSDCATENAPGDDGILAAAVAGIERLNRLYGPAQDGDRFLLLHRRRIWNEGERKWIGWERKRGKLHELNQWLRGATDTTFVMTGSSATEVPRGVRYVITLDADTRLPRGAAKRLVGKMAHPLNRPSLDQVSGRVIEGYAVLQPRVTPSLPTGREGSLFQRVFSSAGGIDPYAAAVSDVYQDLFDEGSYSGKGIYDVDFFEAALAGRVPDNTLLSHDLLEGIFARAGLVSDIEFVEEFPSRYDVAAARQHRWARGDWQLLPWILGPARHSKEDHRRTAIPLIGRWKMIDNLRRTLSAPATFLALPAGWTLPLRAAAIWTAFLLATIALPALLPLISGIVPRRLGISKRSHLNAVVADFNAALLQITFAVVLLAHQAWLMADAIARTLLRLLVSRRNLLEWVTAAQVKFRARLDLGGSYRQMAGGVALAVAAIAFVSRYGRGSWPLAAPFVMLWILAPAIARWASLPPPSAGSNAPSTIQMRALRLIARRTWRFFETFVTAADHMLPPDNFQEEPKPVLAHRTSPTNLGLYLLSVAAARDFGWTGTLETADRLYATLSTMNGLERFRGHFYNWYDTQDLRPLDPKYVSSVDSGNLAGHLIVIGNAIGEMAAGPVIGRDWRTGIGDALDVARECIDLLADGRRTETVTREQLHDALAALSVSLLGAARTPADIAAQLVALVRQAHTAVDIARTLNHERGDDRSVEVLKWVAAVRDSILSHQRDLEQLMPWANLAADARLIAAEQEAFGDNSLKAGDLLFESIPTVAELPDHCEKAIATLTCYRSALLERASEDTVRLERADALIDALKCSANAARTFGNRLAILAKIAADRFAAMEFGFLFDPSRQLLAIGYRVAEGSLDPNCYDLLASEARLASFVAIAKGDLPSRHWFRLGRDLTPVDRGSALISWSGSMFEYLMPSLVMRAPEESMLAQSNRLVVRRQIKYGAELGVPWGVSESAYNARDVELTYQYSNFGVPGLGLKRGLSENVVIAPYATGLAAMVDTEAAVRNFSRLASAGGLGEYGFYEALDYTPTRVPEGEDVAIVRAYMAHHQGMTLVAIDDALRNGSMRARFHAEPIIQATELLLQERTPRDVLVARPRAEEVKTAASIREIVAPMLRRFHSPHDAIPRTHLLSNGRYAVMITLAGSGYSRWHDLAVTRWREDVTCDPWGTYIFLRDVHTGAVWSAGYQPTGIEPESYEVVFSEDRAEITRRDGTLTTVLEVAVSPEDDAEVRRVSILNRGSDYREIELTSYAEVVLASPAADAAHPAFSKLFVQTEFVPDFGAVTATRRLRSPGEAQVWAVHLAVVEGQTVGDLQFETDRSAFFGRARGIRTPISVIDGQPLSGTVGAVLDPVFSLRRRFSIPPGGRARIAFWTLIAPSRIEALDLADKHHDVTAFERAATLAWTQAQVQLRHLGVSPEEAHLFQRVANHVIYANPAMRPSSDVLKRSDRGPSTLWAYGISGDLPIVLVLIDEVEDREIVRQLVRAQEYWRMKRLDVDLVVLNERTSSYDQDLQTSLQGLVPPNQRPRADGEAIRGATFVLRSDLISGDVRNLLRTTARAVLLSRHGSLFEQVNRLEESAAAVASEPKRQPASADKPTKIAAPPATLEFFNGLGGFTPDGREYVTILTDGQWTPAPWINVISNPAFGFQVATTGSGYTWSVNSRENQITPWSNDPVSDSPGEVFYIRDEDSGAVWSPTALPIREASTYIVSHGQGYSRFEHTAHGISLELLQFVSTEDPIKISRLKIRNLSPRSRRLSVSAYVEWVLGASRAASAPYIITEIDPAGGAMLARNPWSSDYGGRVAFADFAGRQTTWTGDRTEFLGRNGALDAPAALMGVTPLSNRVGAGFDPCGVLQTQLRLEPDAVSEIVFFLGETANRAESLALIRRYRTTDLDLVIRAVIRQWDEILGAVQVKTPDRSMDILMNRWLLYQTLACRVWARSAFYQAGGAYGFRDQLQDVTALTTTKPSITREHLLRAAAQQFAEGDVQHWWLPPTGKGVRTRISDDRGWLSYVAARYIETTGDFEVLDEMVPFLEGPTLSAEQQESYFQPTVSTHCASLFEHCARALDASLAIGSHHLPLIGTGDWNDGMTRVGEQGRGESIWLGWFLYSTLTDFARVADRRGESVRAVNWRQHAAALKQSLEQDGWDGAWYRRGYFDDGSPLGSASNSECRIDSIAQSWAVISGAADAVRGAAAMAAVDQYLVRRDEQLALIFTPPFDKGPLDPGYIKGYPPGIRENGGQYTHAAVWSVIAWAMLGEGDKAGELFSILNPINHASTRAGIHRYKVEPYVVCADLYAVAPHIGRGGWTWYTGSAGWMYRAGLESILGFRLRGATLLIDPCIPKAWPRFEIVFRYHSARYEIAVENPRGVSRGVSRVTLDGEVLSAGASGIPLVDGATHRVCVTLG